MYALTDVGSLVQLHFSFTHAQYERAGQLQISKGESPCPAP